MKLILTSSWFSEPELIEQCEKLTGKPVDQINLAIINEAIKGETGNHRWFIDELCLIAQVFTSSIEFIDLQSNSLDHVLNRLETADLIYCFGGNTDYLTKVLRDTGIAAKLPDILSKKVWVGSSAGSCVLCHRESREFANNIFMEDYTTPTFLNVVPIFFLPHFHGDAKRLTPEVAISESTKTELPVYLVSDHAALIITGEPENFNYQMIGKDYLIAQKGKVLTDATE